jgi:hypothetical protein
MVSLKIMLPTFPKVLPIVLPIFQEHITANPFVIVQPLIINLLYKVIGINFQPENVLVLLLKTSHSMFPK